jgi:flagellar FliJ protein
MKFRFRLQKVLEHRQRIENEAKRAYFEAVAKTQEAKDQLTSMYQAIDASRIRAHQIQSQGGGSSTIMTLQDTDLFIRGQQVRIEGQRKVIRELKQVEEREQEALVAAAKERQALEKLRDKKILEFKERVDRQEALEVDDLNIIRGPARKRAEGP